MRRCADDLIAVAKANEYTATRWGMDSISLGMTIAFVMECFEKRPAHAGDDRRLQDRLGRRRFYMLEAIDLIAHRRGFGDKIYRRPKRLAK